MDDAGVVGKEAIAHAPPPRHVGERRTGIRPRPHHLVPPHAMLRQEGKEGAYLSVVLVAASDAK